MKPITATHHVILAGVTAALLSSAALAGCSPRQADAAPAGAAPAPIAVTTALVAMTDVARAIDAGGVVQARTTATITARILAPVREVRVSPGDHVRPGQTLIVLDSDDLAAGARAARSAARAAEQGSKAAAADLLAADAGLALARALTIASPDCRPGGPPPRRNWMTPRRRCGAPKRVSPERPRGPCRPRRPSRAPGPPATRRAPPTPSRRLPRHSTAWLPRIWSSPGTWRRQARPCSAWKTRADSASRSAWTNHASARFDTATSSRSSSGRGPLPSRARWSRSAGR